MKTLIVAVFCAIALVGCKKRDLSSEKQEMLKEWGRNFERLEWYWKNWETGVCYSLIGPTYSYGFSHTAVPCTPAVEALIVNKRESLKPCENKCYKNEKKLQPPTSLNLPTSPLGLRGTGRGAGERTEQK